MAVSSQFRDHVLDLLEPLGALDTRRMFGGLSVRSDGTHFGVIINDRFYLVCDEALRADLLTAGGEVFSYARRDRVVDVKRFVAVPEDMLEETDVLLPFAERALAVGRAG